MEPLTLFSTIKKELMQQQLMRGSAIAAVGACILVFGGALVPRASLSIWGLPLFLVGIGLITWGMLPYRKLKRLEVNPYVVKVAGGMMYCYKGGKEIYRLDLQTVKNMEYVDDERYYGIRFTLEPPEKTTLFLPYFSKNSFTLIKDRIE